MIVIGGGLSGLVAASKLHQSGYNVTIFDAMDRVGGRTHTLKLGRQKNINNFNIYPSS